MVERPPAEVMLTPADVADLVAGQHPQFAGRPLTELDAGPGSIGWDNLVYRLGDDLAVRLPRRRIGADLIVNEQRWLPSLAGRLPLPVPSPVAVGRPAGAYPWRWSIVPWFAGEPAATTDLDPQPAARDLGAFLAALHQPAPPGAPVNPFRSGPAAERRPSVVEWATRIGHRDVLSETGVEAGDLIARFDRLSSVRSARPRRGWIHGDLHPFNLIVAGQRIVAVIDWGDLAVGEPGCDLAAGWMLFDAVDRAHFFEAAGVDDAAVLAQAEAWSIFFCCVFLAADPGGPLGAVGSRTLKRLFPA